MRAIAARDAGLTLISRINRWLIAGAVTLSGAFSLVAAQAFKGHARSIRSAPAPAGAPAPTGADVPAAGASAPSSSGGGGRLQQPAQAPTAAPVAPSAVVSGGS